MAAKKKVLLIGWDGADWKVINPLIDAGKLPNLERLINHGVMGNLATLYPELSPMLWTSIATGKRPFKHGIHGFIEPAPDRSGIRPITNLSRTTKAVWNILSQNSKKCIVAGWWPSHPAEPINGVMVSNHFQKAVGPMDKPWPMRDGTVYPERLVRNLVRLRCHPQQLDEGHILPFVPRANEVDQDKDHRLESIAKIIAETLSIQAAACAIMHHEPWDFAAIYFDAIDHFSHGFMRYHPPRLEWIPKKEFEIYNQVVEAGYQLHDIILGNLLAEAGDEATVMLVSDHGFHADHLRPHRIPDEPAGPAVQHRPYGVLAVKGPGIKKDELIFGASLLDICPTILTLFGLPSGEDMDGKPLLNAFEIPPALEFIQSWDPVPGDAGLHPSDLRIDPLEAQESINQLIALGYIEKPAENKEKAIAQTTRELNYNLARSYMDAGRHADAIPLFEDLITKWPDQYRFGIHLVTCCLAVERIVDARGVLERLFASKTENSARALQKIKEFNQKHKDKKKEELKPDEQKELKKLRNEASKNPFSIEYLMGELLFAEGDNAGALRHLKKAEEIDATQPGLYVRLGDVYLKKKRWKDAERCLQKALKINPDNAAAHLGQCRSALGQRFNLEAAEEALASIGLNYYNPLGHFLLGVALHRLRRIKPALEALKVAVAQNPDFQLAHRRLAYMYRRRFNNLEKAREHLQLAKKAGQRIRAFKTGTVSRHFKDSSTHKEDQEIIAGAGDIREKQFNHVPITEKALQEETIIIVTGLPRSGTSMLMQMLAAGGVPLLTDGKREADEDNPRGYFEYAAAKQLQKNNTWLSEARGKAVKIIAQLLTYMPSRYSYRILFLERDMDEVLKSQRAMLARQGKKGADLAHDRLKEIFTRQVQEVKKKLTARNIPALFVDYGECVKQPRKWAARMNAFLGGFFDEDKMAAAIDPALKRQGSDGKGL